MTYETALELTGYFASILILTSLLMSSAVKLRIINAVGAAVFTVYGILIHSYPTAFLNGVSVIVDIYYIVKLLRSDSHFSARQVTGDEVGLDEFLRVYRNDIGHHFPSYDFQLSRNDLIFLVYTDAIPVGILIGTPTEGRGLRIKLDYSIPKYRDCSVGKFLYEELSGSGLSHLVTGGHNPEHEAYLKKVGFEKDGDEFIKKLN